MSTNGVEARVATGVPGLDRMLGGGLIAGRPYLVTGGSGSGKSLLALRFLLEGLRQGEEVLLVAVDEPPSEILENVESFGWDLSLVKTLDANPGLRAIRRLSDVQEIRTMTDLKAMSDLRDLSREARQAQAADDISIQSIYLKLRQQMTDVPFRRVVVDSMTSIRRFALRAAVDSQAERTEIQSLLRFLSEKEVTTLITATPNSPGILTPEEILTRGEILLTRKWVGDRSVRQAKIVRMRGWAHDPERRPFVINDQGIFLA